LDELEELLNNVWETSQRSEVEKFRRLLRWKRAIRYPRLSASMRRKFFIAVKVRRLPSRNFARFPRSRKEFRGASYDFVRITFCPSLLPCRICLFLFLHFPITFRMALYSALLRFFFGSSQIVWNIARINYY